jgi:hypothetical protein
MTIDTKSGVPAGFTLGGVFAFTQRDADGNIVDQWDAHNVVTDQGLDHALGVILAGSTAYSTWYVLLKDATGDPLDGTETYQTTVFTEITAYDEAARPTWANTTVSGQSIDNSSTVASFAISTAGATVAGAGLASSSTKSGTTAGEILFCAANFASAKTLVSGDTLEVTYTITAASST